MSLSELELDVIITHFQPSRTTFITRIRDFVKPRFSLAYLRSWVRLIKHGTRGNQPWKLDIMTKPREKKAEFRDEYLSQVILSLEQINFKRLNIHIFTNNHFSYQCLNSSSQLITYEFEKYNSMNTLNNSPWENSNPSSPWKLTWEHKSILKKLALESDLNQDKRLYLVLENDSPITASNLEYWLNFRKALKPLSLIPSFVRIEYSKNLGKWMLPNIHDKKEAKLNLSQWKKFKFRNFSFVCIPDYYSGIVIFDFDLLKEYVNSPAINCESSRSLTWWDNGARAAMGLQFVNIPKGFTDRHVHILEKDGKSLHAGAWVHHLPNLYCSVQQLRQKLPSAYEFNELIEGASEKGLKYSS